MFELHASRFLCHNRDIGHIMPMKAFFGGGISVLRRDLTAFALFCKERVLRGVIYRMEKGRKTAVLGGDVRQAYVAAELAAHGYECAVWGSCGGELIGGGVSCRDLHSALAGATAVILPMRSTVGDGRIFCPLLGDEACRPSLFEVVPHSGTVIGGGLPAEFVEFCQNKGIGVFDLEGCESLRVYNAALTAEAAIETAMRELRVALQGARAAVVGYGRIGKRLAFLLRALGAHVTVAARGEGDLAAARLLGMGTLAVVSGNAESLYPLRSGNDVVFATVPAPLFGADYFVGADRGTLYIDLASAPGCADAAAGAAYGVRVISALGLPGKYAPVSAGKIIAQTALQVFEMDEKADVG